MTTNVGLDRDALDMMLNSLDEFVAEALPDERLLELDHEDICPEETIRAMCGEGLGVHLVFIPEEYGGHGRRRVRLLPRLRAAGPRRHRARHLGVRHVPRQRPDPGRRDPRAAQGLAGPDRRAGHPVRLRRHRARGGQRPGCAEDDRHPGGDRRAGRPATDSPGASSGSATAAIADVYTILALAPGGPSWFIVEKGTAGFCTAPPEDKHGIRLSNTAALFLDDVVVPAENLVGGVEGHGLVQAQQVFGYTRLMVAAFGLGGGWAALGPRDRLLARSGSRAAPRCREKQGYTHKLIVPHAVRSRRRARSSRRPRHASTRAKAPAAR